MTDRDAERPMARPMKRRIVGVFGERSQLTPEELAARNAAITAGKIREIFSRKEPKTDFKVHENA